MSFRQWYAIVFLIVFIIYGWLYLMENRYQNVHWGEQGSVLDTWTQSLKPPTDFVD